MTESSTQSGVGWYVVQTLSGKENQVKAYIEKNKGQEELDDYIHEVLMPTETVSEVKHGKKTQKVRKFYPGYVFVKMRLYDENDQLNNKAWYFVREASGVINFVGGTRPTPLRAAEIERILKQVDEAVGKEVPKVQYEIGEEVKITDGPFLNLTGRIDEIDPDRGKLKVSVSIFGRFTPVELEYWQVERTTG